MRAAEIAPAFAENNVPVICVSSNLYAPYAGVMIQSLIDHAGDEHNYDILIMEREITKENKRLLEGLSAGRENVSIRFCAPPVLSDFDMLEPEGDEGRFPVDIYLKILLPHIFKRYSRCIAIDTDMILKHDIADLFVCDMEGKSVAGVPCPVIQGWYHSNRKARTADVHLREYYDGTVGLKEIGEYINAGILMFDVERYRQAVPLASILDAAQNKRFVYREQDVLNYLLQGQIELLDFAWNDQMMYHPYRHSFDALPEETQRAMGKAHEAPYILHWAGRPKPWICPDVELGSEWWAVAWRTPFVPAVFARMIDGMQARQNYFQKKYTSAIDTWDPAPSEIYGPPVTRQQLEYDGRNWE